MAMIDISVKILRYQPGKDEKPHWQVFRYRGRGRIDHPRRAQRDPLEA